MFIKNLLYFIIIFLSLNSYSNPTPLGLELNKATALDLTKKSYYMTIFRDVRTKWLNFFDNS
ncbi:MAG TPA: hypothetical protein LFW10_02430 [Rickettsia endosymbiont of Diachasma alloeum]|nr:hypothetical protein [Rickettsia endosymbiont of Diachasma alloeum]